MSRLLNRYFFPTLSLLLGALVAHIVAAEYESGIPWPEPAVVTPGDSGSPPSDAIVLFDGKDFSQWAGGNWKVKDGYVEASGGDTHTKQLFGDYQLHVEWAEPAVVKGDGQGRGNSGVFLADRYEIQVLDSYNNKTYYDGQCAGIYKEWPPLVNACRKPGEWQTYDIVFEAPRFEADGKLKTPGYVTVFQNGICVQNHTKIIGSTSWDQVPAYTAHPLRMPIRLQYHGNPVLFRNIWVREMPERTDPHKG